MRLAKNLTVRLDDELASDTEAIAGADTLAAAKGMVSREIPFRANRGEASWHRDAHADT